MKVLFARKNTIIKACLNCKQDFVIPKCRESREKCCSSECKKTYRLNGVNERKKTRKRNCQLCGNIFYPRQNQIDAGDGRYCSLTCSVKVMVVAAHQPLANAKRGKAYSLSMAGKIKTGAENPQWTGGKKAAEARTKEKRRANPEFFNNKLREYRANNPHKVREFAASRKRRKYGRLPKGTVQTLFNLQRGRCAICKTSLDNSYHVDHIQPLAKGGLHEKNNIQILCPFCNVTKSAKDPIQYMQERGFLL